MEVSKSWFGQIPEMPWKRGNDAIQKRGTKTVDVEKRTRTRKKMEREVWLEAEEKEEEGT
jgi:hypothetical protein